MHTHRNGKFLIIILSSAVCKKDPQTTSFCRFSARAESPASYVCLGWICVIVCCLCLLINLWFATFFWLAILSETNHYFWIIVWTPVAAAAGQNSWSSCNTRHLVDYIRSILARTPFLVMHLWVWNFMVNKPALI